jgi:hypothetical protein
MAPDKEKVGAAVLAAACLAEWLVLMRQSIGRADAAAGAEQQQQQACVVTESVITWTDIIHLDR